VALNNNDRWSGSRATSEELREICEEATSTRDPSPVIPQWLPPASWLWKQWRGTIVRQVLPRQVLVSTAFAVFITLFFYAPGLHLMWRRDLVRHLAAVERVWTLASGLVSFTLSFFLTQAYTFWREVYLVVRQVQGRLNDIGLLLASAVSRDAESGQVEQDGDELLRLTARYLRLWNLMLYASVTTRFAPLGTPAGLSQLVQSGALTEEERRALLEASTGHTCVLVWISALLTAAFADGRLGAGRSAHEHGLATVLMGKLTDLRSTGSSIGDKLSGRMPLAYTQLVQILVDLFIVFTPLSLLHFVGGVGAVIGTALLTLFYTSILSLAKLLLDPCAHDPTTRAPCVPRARS
jgi:predicted membrane chloride channel (bestrophin family)